MLGQILIQFAQSQEDFRNTNLISFAFRKLATTGYSLNEKWRSCSEEIPGETTKELSKIATEQGSYLICGVDELDPRTNEIFDSADLDLP